MFLAKDLLVGVDEDNQISSPLFWLKLLHLDPAPVHPLELEHKVVILLDGEIDQHSPGDAQIMCPVVSRLGVVIWLLIVYVDLKGLDVPRGHIAVENARVLAEIIVVLVALVVVLPSRLTAVVVGKLRALDKNRLFGVECDVLRVVHVGEGQDNDEDCQTECIKIFLHFVHSSSR